MSYTVPDDSLDHLYPAFRVKLQAVLAETERETGKKWRLAEGYRSQERQTWLYASGRTRPGPIVTWMVHPTNHGAGLGADCYPVSDLNNRKLYEAYRKVYTVYGLSNGAWGKGDLGHVQLSDESVRHAALLWIERGFREDDRISVSVNGLLVPSIQAFLESGHAWLQLRPLLGLLRLAIAGGGGSSDHVTLVGDRGWEVLGPDETPAPISEEVPFRNVAAAGYIPAASLSSWATVAWNAGERKVALVRL